MTEGCGEGLAQAPGSQASCAIFLARSGYSGWLFKPLNSAPSSSLCLMTPTGNWAVLEALLNLASGRLQRR